MVFTDVDASYGNRTIRYVIKTADQVDKAGFCTSGTPDDPYGLAGADRDIDILQNGFLTVFLIAEILHDRRRYFRPGHLLPDPPDL